MSEPGTTVVDSSVTTRQVDHVEVEELTLRWNDTDRISVDYRAAGVDMYGDPADCTSFDEPIDDEALRELLAQYGVLGYQLVSTDPSAVVEQMLEAAVGMLSRYDHEAIAVVEAMLDAVLDDDAKAARPAGNLVRALMRDAC